MPDPQTLTLAFADTEADIYTHAGLPEFPDGFSDTLSDLEKIVTLFHARYGEYHIIPDAKCVVTEQGLEDAARAAWDDRFDESWDSLDEYAQAAYLPCIRAALEAAGIVFADEEGYIVYADPDAEEGALRIDVNFELGDRVFLVHTEAPVARGGSC